MHRGTVKLFGLKSDMLGVVQESPPSHDGGTSEHNERSYETQQPQLPKLTESHHRFISYLEGQYLWEGVNGNETTPPENAEALWKWKIKAG